MIGYLRRGRAAVVAEHSLGVDTVEALHGQFTRQKFSVDQADTAAKAAPQISRTCVRSRLSEMSRKERDFMSTACK